MTIDFIVGKTQSFLGEVAKTNAAVWLGRTVVQLQANALPIALAVFIVLGLVFCYRKYRMDIKEADLKKNQISEFKKDLTKDINISPVQDPIIIPDQYKLEYNGNFPFAIVKALKDKGFYTNLPVHQVPIVDNDSFPKWDELKERIMIVPKKFNKQEQTFVLVFKIEQEKLKTEKKVAFVQKIKPLNWSFSHTFDNNNTSHPENLIRYGKVIDPDEVQWNLAS